MKKTTFFFLVVEVSCAWLYSITTIKKNLHLHSTAKNIIIVMLFAASRAVVCFDCRVNVCMCVFICSLNLWRLILAQLHVPDLFLLLFFLHSFYISCCWLLLFICSNLTYNFRCCCRSQSSLFFIFSVNGSNFTISFSFFLRIAREKFTFTRSQRELDFVKKWDE